MSNLQEYKCPCCDGAIEFDANLQKMKCPYCDNEFEMETLAAYDEELKNQGADDMNWETKAGQEWQSGETDGKRYIIKKADEISSAFCCAKQKKTADAVFFVD